MADIYDYQRFAVTLSCEFGDFYVVETRKPLEVRSTKNLLVIYEISTLRLVNHAWTDHYKIERKVTAVESNISTTPIWLVILNRGKLIATETLLNRNYPDNDSLIFLFKYNIKHNNNIALLSIDIHMCRKSC